jgi:ankyrin repeat protein
MTTLLVGCVLAAVASADDAGVRELLGAVRKGDAARVESLLQSAPRLVDARGPEGVSATRLALYYRHPEIAELLIVRGATLDLYDAAAAGRIERMRELVAKDPATVNRRSSDGATPLGLAAFFGHLEAVRVLLDSGAQVNLAATNPAFPFVPLHSAMSAGHQAIVDVLLARGADVNIREGGGLTVLHEAAGLGSREYVDRFLKLGANPAARTDDGKLPEDFAREGGHADVTGILERARAAAAVRH